MEEKPEDIQNFLGSLENEYYSPTVYKKKEKKDKMILIILFFFSDSWWSDSILFK